MILARRRQSKPSLELAESVGLLSHLPLETRHLLARHRDELILRAVGDLEVEVLALQLDHVLSKRWNFLGVLLGRVGLRLDMSSRVVFCRATTRRVRLANLLDPAFYRLFADEVPLVAFGIDLDAVEMALCAVADDRTWRTWEARIDEAKLGLFDSEGVT